LGRGKKNHYLGGVEVRDGIKKREKNEVPTGKSVTMNPMWVKKISFSGSGNRVYRPFKMVGSETGP